LIFWARKLRHRETVPAKAVLHAKDAVRASPSVKLAAMAVARGSAEEGAGDETAIADSSR
jgi:hypothetical protein